MQHDPEQIAKLYDQKFGRGWKSAMATALDVRNATISNAKQGAVLTSLYLLFEFFEATPIKNWPERWGDMRALAHKQIKKEQKMTDATIHTNNELHLSGKMVGWIYSGPSTNIKGKRPAATGRNARYTFFYEKGEKYGERGPLHTLEIPAYLNGKINADLIDAIKAHIKD